MKLYTLGLGPAARLMFVIEDEIHAEPGGKYASFDEALAELRRRSGISWDQPPNQAPCTNWRTCGRRYLIIEYEDSGVPWEELRRVYVVDVSSSGVTWAAGFDSE